jgi:hypothetical protein
MKRFLQIAYLAVYQFGAVGIASADMQQGVVVWDESCDLFIANGPSGLYVLEWYGGYDPRLGDTIIGDINSFGFKDVFYPSANRAGRVWVEDYLVSEDAAWDAIQKRC